MNADKIIAEMVAHAKTGAKVYPFMWQPVFGRSNHVSAAVRKAKKAGLLIEGGKDGTGKPYYIAPMPAATHAVSNTVN